MKVEENTPDAVYPLQPLINVTEVGYSEFVALVWISFSPDIVEGAEEDVPLYEPHEDFFDYVSFVEDAESALGKGLGVVLFIEEVVVIMDCDVVPDTCVLLYPVRAVYCTDLVDITPVI